MELIYDNHYRASYKVVNHLNPNCTIQIVIGTITNSYWYYRCFYDKTRNQKFIEYCS